MTVKIFLTIFITVLLAELGDKNSACYSTFRHGQRKFKVDGFSAAAAALVVATGLAVLIGSNMEKYINPKYLSWVAGTGFILIGIWTIIRT